MRIAGVVALGVAGLITAWPLTLVRVYDPETTVDGNGVEELQTEQCNQSPLEAAPPVTIHPRTVAVRGLC